METYVLICVIILFAGFTQGLSGFGSILLSLPLLAIFLDIKIVIPFTALAGLAMTTILLIQLWQHVRWERIAPFLIAAVPGIPLGVLFLKKVDKGVVQWVLGILLLAYALFNLLVKHTSKGKPRRWAYFLGFLGGCLGGAFSASGPAVIVYATLQNWGKDQVKAAIQGMFFVSGVLVVGLYVLNGLTTPIVLKYFGVSFPMLLLGTYIGSFFYGKINDVQYRKVMFVLLGLLGAFMIYRA